LLGIGDVIPSAVRLPTIGDYLNQHPAGRGLRDMRRPLLVGFHIQFYLLAFQELVLFDIFQIDAGIFNRRVFLAAGNLNGDTGDRIVFAGARLGV